jgi:DNA replication protein DnaC
MEGSVMVNQSTTNKLIEMRLTAMADAFRIQQDDKSMKEVSFDDRFGMLVDVEYTSRKNNRLKRLIRNAELEQSDACIAGIDYTSGRKLNKSLINRLATCEYITEYRNIFISGATGSGKTYMACAFGLEACKQYYTVKYTRLPDLLLDLEAARIEGTFAKVLSKYTKPLLLIIDEWLLLKLTESESRNLFELIHKRRKKSSTLFCSQFREEGWYERLGGDDNPLADAIMDRIVYDAYKINIESIDPAKDLSMREVYGLDQMQSS